MIDDDPDLKWSGAWWARVVLGIWAPVFLAGATVAALVLGKAYGIGEGRWRRWALVLVEGTAAHAMALAYAGAALALFAYAYARRDLRLNAAADPLLAAGLLALLAGLGWFTWITVVA